MPLPLFTPLFQCLFTLFALKERLHLGKQCAGQAFDGRLRQWLCLIFYDDRIGWHPS